MPATTELPPQEQVPAIITEGQLYGLADMMPEHLDEAIGFANAVPIGGELRPVTEQDDPKIVAGALLARIGIRGYGDTNKTPATVLVEKPDGSIVPKQFVTTREDFGTTLRPKKTESKLPTREAVVIPVIDESETVPVQVTVETEAAPAPSKQFKVSREELDTLSKDARVRPVDPSVRLEEPVAISYDSWVRNNSSEVMDPKNPISNQLRALHIARNIGASHSKRVTSDMISLLHDLNTKTNIIAPELMHKVLTSISGTRNNYNDALTLEGYAASMQDIVKSLKGKDGGDVAQALVYAVGLGLSFKTGNGQLQRTTRDRLADLIKAD